MDWEYWRSWIRHVIICCGLNWKHHLKLPFWALKPWLRLVALFWRLQRPVRPSWQRWVNRGRCLNFVPTHSSVWSSSLCLLIRWYHMDSSAGNSWPPTLEPALPCCRTLFSEHNRNYHLNQSRYVASKRSQQDQRFSHRKWGRPLYPHLRF